MGKPLKTKKIHGVGSSGQSTLNNYKFVEVNVASDDIGNININKQNKHVRGTNNFDPNRSELTISIDKLKDLVDKYITEGERINDIKIRINFHEIIGIYRNPYENSEAETSYGILHKSKTGWHVVPSNPKIGGIKND